MKYWQLLKFIQQIQRLILRWDTLEGEQQHYNEICEVAAIVEYDDDKIIAPFNFYSFTVNSNQMRIKSLCMLLLMLTTMVTRVLFHVMENCGNCTLFVC